MDSLPLGSQAAGDLQRMGLTLRGVAADEWTAYVEAVFHGFHEEPDDDYAAMLRDVSEIDRLMVVTDGPDIVGTAESMGWTVAVPHADPVSCAAVTSVTVAPTHRRRGLLRAMMLHQLEQVHERGEPLAALYASEAPIYPRFGYGIAASGQQVMVQRQHATLRPEVTTGGRVRFVDLEQAARRFPPILEQALQGRPGWVSRPPGMWSAATHLDPERYREGFGPRRAVAVEDERGYALYRTSRPDATRSDGASGGTVRVEELVATDPQAEASLWSYLFGIDLMSRIEAANRPPDDPLRFMLADPGREMRTHTSDFYVRIVDVPAALTARGYAVDDALTLAVTDPVCPWNAGTWRLEVAHGRGSCERTDAPPDLTIGVTELATVYLGGFTATRLEAATLVQAQTPGAALRADRLFAAPRPPWNPTAF